MGAGGGMWAKAREELRRPGLRGGGGGKPLLGTTGLTTATGTTATGGNTIFSSFLLTAVCGFDLTAGAAIWLLSAGWTATLFALFTAVFTAVFEALFGIVSETFSSAFLAVPLGTAFDTALSTGFLLVALDAGFGDGFGTGFFGVGLDLVATATGFLPGGFKVTLTGGLEPLTPGLRAGLTIVLTTAFGVGLADDLTGDFAGGLPNGFDALTVLPTTLAAGLPFFVAFAFTNRLL